jgi:hypothetical protein
MVRPTPTPNEGDQVLVTSDGTPWFRGTVKSVFEIGLTLEPATDLLTGEPTTAYLGWDGPTHRVFTVEPTDP